METKIPPILSPACSQRDPPESVFDLCTMLRGALSVHAAEGRHGKSYSAHCDLCEAFVTVEREDILKVEKQKRGENGHVAAIGLKLNSLYIYKKKYDRIVARFVFSRLQLKE